MRFVREAELGQEPAESPRFTAGVLRTEVLSRIVDDGMAAHRFSYPPGGRSAWHTHQGEQAILVTVGSGLVMKWGDPLATPVAAGDWVHVQPGEKHWHGAAPDQPFAHVAVTASGGTNWHEPVSDEDYSTALPDLE
jgi:quercetin dioxygenase-like cupin family protein